MQQNGGEVIDSIGEQSDLRKRVTQQDLIDEENLKICMLGNFGTRCFSSMFPSIPKGEIVSMNGDAMEEYSRTLIVTMFFIDDNIVIRNRVVYYDHCIEDNGLIIY